MGAKCKKCDQTPFYSYLSITGQLLYIYIDQLITMKRLQDLLRPVSIVLQILWMTSKTKRSVKLMITVMVSPVSKNVFLLLSVQDKLILLSCFNLQV